MPTDKCDFCSSRMPVWEYPATDFTMSNADLGLPGPEWGSKGSWAACRDCYELIEVNDQEALARRCAEGFVEEAKRDPNIRRAVKRRLRATETLPHYRLLQREFYRHRTGPPLPITAPRANLINPDGQHRQKGSYVPDDA